MVKNILEGFKPIDNQAALILSRSRGRVIIIYEPALRMRGRYKFKHISLASQRDHKIEHCYIGFERIGTKFTRSEGYFFPSGGDVFYRFEGKKGAYHNRA
jgi:hypothetical protein